MTGELKLEIPKLPWPDEKTKIFSAGEIRPGLAWLPQSPGQWHSYAEGYREAAEWLYAKWREDRVKPDYLAYPMVYLYRHYVELMLKEILQSGSQVGVVKLGKHWKYDHDLKRLWDKVRSVLSPLFPKEPLRDLANAQRLIYELHERDNLLRSFATRLAKKVKSIWPPWSG